MGPVPRTTPDEPAATRRRTTLAAPFLLALLVSSSVQPTSGRDVPPRYRPVARDCHQLFSLLASSPQPRVISAEGRLDCDEDGGRVVVSKSATLQGAAAIDFGARIGAILLRPGVVMRMRELVLIRSEGGDDFAFVGSAGGPVAQLQLRDVAVVRGEGNGGGGTEASEPIFMGRGRGGPTLRSSSGPGCPGVVRLARNCTVQVNASGTVTGNCAPEGCDADGECLGGDRWDDRRLSALLEAAGFGACGILREGVLSAGLHASQTASVAAAGCLAVLLLLMWLGPKVLGAWGPRFGMLLWELLSGRKAYCTKSQRDMAADVVAGSRPPLPLHCPNDVAAVIRECWDPDRSRRPNAQALLERLARLAGAHAQTACYRIIEEEEEGAEDRQRADAGATSISANLHRPFARERSIALPPPRSREAASPKPPQTPQWQSRNGREDGTPQEKRIIPSPQEPKPAEDEAIPNDSLLQSKPQNEGQCGPQGPCKGGPLGPGGGVAQRLAGSGPQGLVVCGPQGPVGAGLQAPSRQGPRWVVATNVELTDLSSDSESEALSDSGQLTPRLDTATTSQIQCSVARSDAGIPTAINGTHSGGSQGA
eukprot:evm.model.scf_16.20 EVM.evm.TU.scf_16.20   scf_16:230227-234136(+)